MVIYNIFILDLTKELSKKTRVSAIDNANIYIYFLLGVW